MSWELIKTLRKGDSNTAIYNISFEIQSQFIKQPQLLAWQNSILSCNIYAIALLVTNLHGLKLDVYIIYSHRVTRKKIISLIYLDINFLVDCMQETYTELLYG